MVDRIKLVQGDTLPSIIVTVFKDDGSGPMDLRGSTPRLKFRESGSDTIKETLVGNLVNGYDDGSGTINLSPPYNLPDGRGGRVEFTWTQTALDTAGSFEGEVEVTFIGGPVQTVYDRLKFTVREQF
jgi:hypothetical protein